MLLCPVNDFAIPLMHITMVIQGMASAVNDFTFDVGILFEGIQCVTPRLTTSVQLLARVIRSSPPFTYSTGPWELGESSIINNVMLTSSAVAQGYFVASNCARTALSKLGYAKKLH